MDKLQSFALDDATREAVKDFLLKQLEKETITRVFGGKSVVGILESRQLVESSFSELVHLFKPKQDKKQDTAE